MEYCIVYFSTSAGLFQEADLVTILEKSRANNARANITGVLLYVRGSIIQVLEGSSDALDALYKRIQHDPRHKNVTRVLNRPITQRLFTDWSMGYETLTTRQLDDFKALLHEPGGNAANTDLNDHNILKMLKLFYESNRWN